MLQSKNAVSKQLCNMFSTLIPINVLWPDFYEIIPFILGHITSSGVESVYPLVKKKSEAWSWLSVSVEESYLNISFLLFFSITMIFCFLFICKYGVILLNQNFYNAVVTSDCEVKKDNIFAPQSSILSKKEVSVVVCSATNVYCTSYNIFSCIDFFFCTNYNVFSFNDFFCTLHNLLT